MPGFTPGSGARDGALMGKALKADYERAKSKVNAVFQRYNNAELFDAADAPFVRDLLKYLLARRDENFIFSFNTEQLHTRSTFIDAFLSAVQHKDLNKQLQLLEDKNILGFKGYFSSRLYDQFIERRGAIRERLQQSQLLSTAVKPQQAMSHRTK